MTRGIDDVQTGLGELVLGALPVAGGSGGGDGDTTLLLLRHPVHGGGTLVGLADLVVHAGVVQNTLGSGGLARIDVGHDADVTGILQKLSRTLRLPFGLPAVVGEGLVGLGHLVGVLALLHSAAQVVGSVHDLAGQTLLHGLRRGCGHKRSASCRPRAWRRRSEADLDGHLQVAPPTRRALDTPGKAALFVGKPCEPVALAACAAPEPDSGPAVPRAGCQRLCGRPHLQKPASLSWRTATRFLLW